MKPINVDISKLTPRNRTKLNHLCGDRGYILGTGGKGFGTAKQYDLRKCRNDDGSCYLGPDEYAVNHLGGIYFTFDQIIRWIETAPQVQYPNDERIRGEHKKPIELTQEEDKCTDQAIHLIGYELDSLARKHGPEAARLALIFSILNHVPSEDVADFMLEVDAWNIPESEEEAA